jgi:hypothetical protein
MANSRKKQPRPDAAPCAPAFTQYDAFFCQRPPNSMGAMSAGMMFMAATRAVENSITVLNRAKKICRERMGNPASEM